MGLFRRIAGFLGIGKDEAEELKDEEENDVVPIPAAAAAAAAQHTHRKGFSVPLQIPVDRPLSGPVLVPCSSGKGGVQLRSSSSTICLQARPVIVLVGDETGSSYQRNLAHLLNYHGFRWYAKRLRMDEDGDVADEFLEEVPTEKCASNEEQHRPLRRFQVKYSTRPVKLSNQARCLNGNIQFGAELQGRLEWV